MKTILINTLRDEFKNLQNDSITTRQKLGNLGGNLGNTLFLNAVREQLQFDGVEYFWDDESEDKDKIYIWPCSNFIDPNYDGYKILTPRIEARKDMKIVPIGLGTQANLKDTPKNVMHRVNKDVIRLFEVVSERCHKIGVRGEFTAECLGLAGIKNVEVVGCPSVYKSLAEDKPRIKKPSRERVVFNFQPARCGVNSMLKIAMRNQADWFAQTSGEIIEHEDRSVLDNIKDPIRYGSTHIKRIAEYQKEHMIKCYSYEEWNRKLEEGDYTFSFGYRFHGNMMSLRNGIPALWIKHDMRVKELAEAIHLPALDVKDVKRSTSIEELIEKCDYSEFIKLYEVNKSNYISFLKENSIELMQ